MWKRDETKEAKIRESLSRIVLASATGYTLGVTLGVMEKLMLGRSIKIRTRGTDLMLLGGAYAAAEVAMEGYGARESYIPIVSGCVAGAFTSRGSIRSLVTNSLLTATAGYLLEHRGHLINKQR